MPPIKSENQAPDAVEPSPLDNPLNSTYVRVVIIEVVVIVLLYVVGRLFQ